MPAVISSPVRLFLLPEKSTLSLCLSGFLRSAAYRPTSAAITACPSPSAHALFNLSKLAVWWLRLGIGNERMHLTLKKEATKPAATNFLQQQARFDKFIEVFNKERPHEALDMNCPADVYTASTRPYQGLPDIDYPFHDRTIVVTHCGRICLGRKKINFSTVFAGQAVGIKEVQDDIWLVSFMDYDLGYFDLETRVLEPLENPFGPKVLPM